MRCRRRRRCRGSVAVMGAECRVTRRPPVRREATSPAGRLRSPPARKSGRPAVRGSSTTCPDLDLEKQVLGLSITLRLKFLILTLTLRSESMVLALTSRLKSLVLTLTLKSQSIVLSLPFTAESVILSVGRRRVARTTDQLHPDGFLPETPDD